MKGSLFPALASASVICLAAGHGGRDSGAVSGANVEREDAIVIVNEMARLLSARLPAGAVIVCPHEQDTHETIPWLNAHYPRGAWALEIHRDSADTITAPDASLRCGIYYGDSRQSASIADHVAAAMRAAGAAPSTWARSHRSSRHKGGLGWINQLHCFSHLLEAAFVEGHGGEEHLHKLALILARGVYTAFTGRPWPENV